MARRTGLILGSTLGMTLGVLAAPVTGGTSLLAGMAAAAITAGTAAAAGHQHDRAHQARSDARSMAREQLDLQQQHQQALIAERQRTDSKLNRERARMEAGMVRAMQRRQRSPSLMGASGMNAQPSEVLG